MFRMVVQDARRTPTSGKVVTTLGSYDPHAKRLLVDKDKIAFYLEHGAQPSNRAARLLKADGVTLPKWVDLGSEQQRAIRNPDKRRSTRPAETVEPAAESAETETPAEAPADTPETAAEAATEAVPANSVAAESDEDAAQAEQPAETDVEPASADEAEAESDTDTKE